MSHAAVLATAFIASCAVAGGLVGLVVALVRGERNG